MQQDLTPKEQDEFSAYGIGYAQRYHGEYKKGEIYTLAITRPNSNPQFYPATHLWGGGRNGNCFNSRAEAIEQGKRIIDEWHDELERKYQEEEKRREQKKIK